MARVKCASYYLFLAIIALAFSLPHVHTRGSRNRRAVTRIGANQQIFYPTLSNQYGPPAVNNLNEAHLQEFSHGILNRINSELSHIESQLTGLVNRFNALHQNNVAIDQLHLPKEYGPPTYGQASLYNEKFIRDNADTIQSSVNNLRSIVQHLESQSRKHESAGKKGDNVPTIVSTQHYHISSAGVLPEFLTLDPFVAYGPAPNVNFAPPAPGSSTGLSVPDAEIYSPPDGVLLAPPAPGFLPIRTRVF